MAAAAGNHKRSPSDPMLPEAASTPSTSAVVRLLLQTLTHSFTEQRKNEQSAKDGRMPPHFKQNTNTIKASVYSALLVHLATRNPTHMVAELLDNVEAATQSQQFFKVKACLACLETLQSSSRSPRVIHEFLQPRFGTVVHKALDATPQMIEYDEYLSCLPSLLNLMAIHTTAPQTQPLPPGVKSVNEILAPATPTHGSMMHGATASGAIIDDHDAIHADDDLLPEEDEVRLAEDAEVEAENVLADADAMAEEQEEQAEEDEEDDDDVEDEEGEDVDGGEDGEMEGGEDDFQDGGEEWGQNEWDDAQPPPEADFDMVDDDENGFGGGGLAGLLRRANGGLIGGDHGDMLMELLAARGHGLGGVPDMDRFIHLQGGQQRRQPQVRPPDGILQAAFDVTENTHHVIESTVAPPPAVPPAVSPTAKAPAPAPKARLSLEQIQAAMSNSPTRNADPPSTGGQGDAQPAAQTSVDDQIRALFGPASTTTPQGQQTSTTSVGRDGGDPGLSPITDRNATPNEGNNNTTTTPQGQTVAAPGSGTVGAASSAGTPVDPRTTQGPTPATPASSDTQQQPAQQQQQQDDGPAPWDGILDVAFLGELPPDLRRDILREHWPILQHPPSARDVDGRRTQLHPLFIAALPSELQAEVFDLERDMGPPPPPAAPVAAPGAAAPPSAAPPAAPAVSETAMLIASVPPELREEILLTCDLAELSAEPALLAEATALRDRQQRLLQERLAAEQQAQRQRHMMGRGGDGSGGPRLHDFGMIAPAGMDRDAVNMPRSRRHGDGPISRTSTGRPPRSIPLPRVQDAVSVESVLLIVPLTAIPIEDLCRILANALSFDTPNSGNFTKTFSNIARDPKSASAVVQALCKTCITPIDEISLAFLRKSTPRHLQRSLTLGAPKPLAVVQRALVILKELVKSNWFVCQRFIRLMADDLTFPSTPSTTGLNKLFVEERKTLLEAEKAAAEKRGSTKQTQEQRVLELTGKPLSRKSKIYPCAEKIGDAPTESECEAVKRVPIDQLAQIALQHCFPEVHNTLAEIIQLAIRSSDNSYEADQPSKVDKKILPSESNPEVLLHYRHEHPLVWSDPCQTNQDYQRGGGVFLCNACRVHDSGMCFHCDECHFDLCANCACDHSPPADHVLRTQRFFLLLLEETNFASSLLEVLSKGASASLSSAIVLILQRGVEILTMPPVADVGNFNAEWIQGVERSLLQCAAKITKYISQKLPELQKKIAAKQQSNGVFVPPPSPSATAQSPSSSPSKAAKKEEKEQTMNKSDAAHLLEEFDLPPTVLEPHAYALFVIQAKRQVPQPLALRKLWNAVNQFLAELNNLVSSVADRNTLVLPTSILPLIQGFSQFHLLQSRDFESKTNLVERTETEVLLGENSFTSQVSERACKTAGGQLTTRETLPPSLQRFVESNRLTINALIRSDPRLLETGFKFMANVPRLIDFEFKVKEFRKKLPQQHRHRGPQLELTLARSSCFTDTFTQLRGRRPEELMGPLHIRFKDEEGADAGGLTREWFQLLAEDFINPMYALFITTSEGMTFQPNPLSDVNPEHLLYFRFVGRIVALSIFHEIPIDLHFTRSVYRHIAGIEPGLVDLEAIDPGMSKSMQQLLSMNLSEVDLGLDFTVTEERFGEVKEIELCPGGKDREVTDENKKEYIRLRCAMRMTKGIESQLHELLTGFYEIIPRSAISVFSEQEVELLVCGMPDIDVEDLRVNTDYQGYSANSPQIRWFWECVAGMSKQDKANLLQFATGCSKVPPGGFGNLEGLSGKQRFSVVRVDTSPELLPVAHTCFNRIDLPMYPSSDVLREKLTVAITYGAKGFSLL